MEVEVKFFGPYAEVVGKKTMRRGLPEGATVVDLFRDIADDYANIEDRILTEDGTISKSVTVTKNARNVSLADGAQTVLENGDIVRASPPVQGG